MGSMPMISIRIPTISPDGATNGDLSLIALATSPNRLLQRDALWGSHQRSLRIREAVESAVCFLEIA